MDKIIDFFAMHGFLLERIPAQSVDGRDSWHYDGGLDGLTIQVVPHARGNVWVRIDLPNGDGVDLSGRSEGWSDNFGIRFLSLIEK